MTIFDSYACTAPKNKILLLKNPKVIYRIKLLDENIEIDQKVKPSCSTFVTLKQEKKHVISEFKSVESLVDSFKINKSKSKKTKFSNSVDISQADILESKNRVVSKHDSVIVLQKTSKSSKQKIKQAAFSSSRKKQLGEVLFPDDCNSIKSVFINAPLSLHELSIKLQMPAAEIITMLFLNGISATINQVIDLSICKQITDYYGFIIVDSDSNQDANAEKIPEIVLSGTTISRSPVAAILGHVDHGKTSILDAMKNTNLATSEIGGITQAISVHEVNCPHNSSYTRLVLLDTPGHEAFAATRLLSAHVADIVILVVAADDGLRPQTIESIKYVLLKKIPCIIAINKIDRHDAKPDYIKKQLSEYQLIDKDWGGSVSIVQVSALEKINIDVLLAKACSLAKSLNLKIDPTQLACGTILDSYLDKAKGNVSTLVIANGTLNIGDVLVSGTCFGKVKSISDVSGNKYDKACSSPVLEILGFSSIPQPGMHFRAVSNEKQARRIISSANSSDYLYAKKKTSLRSRITLKGSRKINAKKLNLIIKADTQGSVDAIIYLFSQISQSKIQLNVVLSGIGDVSSKDLDLAFTSKSSVVAFNVNYSSHAQALAEKLIISLRKFYIIYNLLDCVKKDMLKLLDAEYDKNLAGHAEVQAVFYVQKRSIAGCIVQSGKLRKNISINIHRNGKLIQTAIISSIKRIKNEVDEVNAVNECGIMCEDYDSWQSGDLIEAYELSEKARVL